MNAANAEVQQDPPPADNSELTTIHWQIRPSDAQLLRLIAKQEGRLLWWMLGHLIQREAKRLGIQC